MYLKNYFVLLDFLAFLFLFLGLLGLTFLCAEEKKEKKIFYNNLRIL